MKHNKYQHISLCLNSIIKLFLELLTTGFPIRAANKFSFWFLHSSAHRLKAAFKNYVKSESENIHELVLINHLYNMTLVTVSKRI